MSRCLATLLTAAAVLAAWTYPVHGEDGPSLAAEIRALEETYNQIAETVPRPSQEQRIAVYSEFAQRLEDALLHDSLADEETRIAAMTHLTALYNSTGDADKSAQTHLLLAALAETPAEQVRQRSYAMPLLLWTVQDDSSQWDLQHVVENHRELNDQCADNAIEPERRIRTLRMLTMASDDYFRIVAEQPEPTKQVWVRAEGVTPDDVATVLAELRRTADIIERLAPEDGRANWLVENGYARLLARRSWISVLAEDPDGAIRSLVEAIEIWETATQREPSMTAGMATLRLLDVLEPGAESPERNQFIRTLNDALPADALHTARARAAIVTTLPTTHALFAEISAAAYARFEAEGDTLDRSDRFWMRRLAGGLARYHSSTGDQEAAEYWMERSKETDE